MALPAIVTGTVVVAKNPCFHPGDVRKFQARPLFRSPGARGRNKIDCTHILAPAGRGRCNYLAPCPRLIGSRLELASPTRGRIVAVLDCSLSAGRTLPLGRKTV